MAGLQPLTLGDFVFQDQEIPENLSLGFAQMLAVHTLIGGKRVIQTLGIDYDPVTWTGVIRSTASQKADQRSRLLLRMMSEGAVVRLSYETLAFDVVVNKYQANIISSIKVEYSITIEIQSDRSGATTSSAPPSVDSQINQANINAQSNYQKLSGMNTNVAA